MYSVKNMGTLHMAKKNQLMQLTNKFYIEYMHTYICVGIYIITPEFEEDSLVRENIGGKNISTKLFQIH